MNKEIRDVIIAGGGASGLVAGIIAAKRGLSVTVIEQNKTVGKKLSITGNGKCNFTNLNQNVTFYNSGDIKKAYDIINKIRGEGLVDLFSSFGIEALIKRGREFDNYMARYVYPAGESAKEFVNILQDKLLDLKAKIKTGTKIIGIKKRKFFEVETVSNNETYTYLSRNMIIATGGLALPSSGSDGNLFNVIKDMGHDIIKPLPSLTSLRYNDDIDLSGLRCVCEITALKNGNELIGKQIGEVQFGHKTLSGIGIMQLSGKIARALDEGAKVECKLDFFREEMISSLFEKFKKRRIILENSPSNKFLKGFTYEKLVNQANTLISGENKTVSDITDDEIYALSMWLKSFSFDIISVGGFDVAQSTSGGVSLSGVTEFLESKIVKGLYFTGEILDVDGTCGGYNLTWAFAGAYVVGNAVNGD